MKKFFLFLVVLVCTTFFVSGQQKNIQKIYVSGFNGEKPLKKDTGVSVYGLVPNGSIMILDAYRGETKKKFLERITASPIDGSKTVGAKK